MQINHLLLRTGRDKAPAVRTCIENAIRTTVTESRRLLLIRKMDLGRLPTVKRSGALEAHINGKMTNQFVGAVHGSLSSANNANAVWFRSNAEALSHFWQLVLSGKRPTAWYWKLAIAGWDGQQPASWLSEQLDQLDRDGRKLVYVGQALVRAIEMGSGRSVLQLLGQISSAKLARFCQMHRKENTDVTLSQNHVTRKNGADFETMSRSELVNLPVGRALTPAVAKAIQQAINGNRFDVAHSIAFFALAAARPDRANQTKLLIRNAAMVVERLTSKMVTEDEGRRSPKQAPVLDSRRWDKIVSDQPASDALTDGALRTDGFEKTDEEQNFEQRVSQNPVPAEMETSAERVFAKAGIFLTIPLLHRMGIAEIVETHRLSDQYNFPAQLLVHMAERFGQADGSAMPIWLGLDEEETARAQHDLSGPLRKWVRIADKYLRKITRRRIHDLADRSGWLIRNDEMIDVRFRLASADIALRRYALDVDPGWVPWLGRVVHFHFADTPLDEST